jgi:hypothetical protein
MKKHFSDPLLLTSHLAALRCGLAVCSVTGAVLEVLGRCNRGLRLSLRRRAAITTIRLRLQSLGSANRYPPARTSQSRKG